jgi:TonB family protein
MVDYYTYKARQYGVLCTIILHGIIFVLLLMHITTPIPPYPEGGGGPGNGIELNLGFSDVGSGSVPLEMPTASEVAKPLAVAKLEADKGKLVTQDLEEVPQINQQVAEPKKVKKDIKKIVTEQPDKTVKKEPVKPQPTQPVPNQKAMYHGDKSSSYGNDKVQGAKGDPNGNLGKDAFSGKGGKDGSGGGKGGGQGTGTGTGIGPGISFDLKDRKSIGSLPKPEYKHQVEGTVVVEVTVDKDGKVTQATAGVRGSTTLDESLCESARQAALQARFDKKPDAPAYQKGTITYNFRLQ